jgi:hypothetical protein
MAAMRKLGGARISGRRRGTAKGRERQEYLI